jgi:hypothetical protein
MAATPAPDGTIEIPAPYPHNVGINPVPGWLLGIENGATISAIAAALPFGTVGQSADGHAGSIAPPGAPVVIASDGGTKLILDFDGAQPALATIGSTPQAVKLTAASSAALADLADRLYRQSAATMVEAKIGGAAVGLKMTFTDPTAAWSGLYGPTWSAKSMWDAACVGGTFTIAKVGADYVMNFQGRTPPTGWADCTTTDDLFYWSRVMDFSYLGINWDNFGLKYDHSIGDGGRLDPSITIAQAKAALAASSLIHLLDADNTATPAQSDITVTHEKDPAATATDRKAVITVTFPAGLKGWCIYQGDPAEQVGAAADGSQAKPLDGNTQAVFNVTYSKDGSFQPIVWVGRVTKNNAPGLRFP